MNIEPKDKNQTELEKNKYRDNSQLKGVHSTSGTPVQKTTADPPRVKQYVDDCDEGGWC